MVGGTVGQSPTVAFRFRMGRARRFARHASSGMTGGDPHGRRPSQRGAVSVERRPADHGIAGSAVPAGVSAAVAEAGDMADEDLVRAERVTVRAAARRPRHPLAIRGLNKVAQHDYNRMSADRQIATIAV